MLDGDVDQLAGAPINGVAAHFLELVHLVLPAVVSHIDSAPHERVLADFVPFRAHHLSALQKPDRADTCQDRRRDVVGDFEPVSAFDDPHGFRRWPEGLLVLFLAAHFWGNVSKIVGFTVVTV